MEPKAVADHIPETTLFSSWEQSRNDCIPILEYIVKRFPLTVVDKFHCDTRIMDLGKYFMRATKKKQSKGSPAYVRFANSIVHFPH